MNAIVRLLATPAALIGSVVCLQHGIHELGSAHHSCPTGHRSETVDIHIVYGRGQRCGLLIDIGYGDGRDQHSFVDERRPRRRLSAQDDSGSANGCGDSARWFTATTVQIVGPVSFCYNRQV